METAVKWSAQYGKLINGRLAACGDIYWLLLDNREDI
jgi:hypothetical protein